MKEKARNNFFENEFNLERAEDNLYKLAENCTLKEVLWIIRNICYDMTSYVNNENKGKIYDDSYSRKQIEQATQLQRDISTACDLFSQIIVNHNEFNDDYFKERTISNGRIGMLKDKIKELEEKIENEV